MQTNRITYIIIMHLLKNSNIYKIILIAIISILTHSAWTNLPLIATGSFQPITSLISPTLNTTSSYSINFNPAFNSTTALTWGLAITGYRCYLTDTFSFKVTINSLNSSGLIVNVKPQYNTYLAMMRMNYIVTGLTFNSTPAIQIVTGCFKCLNISQNTTLQLNVTSQNESFFQNSSITNNATINIRSFLYAFGFSNLNGQLNYLEVQTSLASGLYQHTVITKELNIMDFVCITAISWSSSQNMFGKGIAAFFQDFTLNYASQSSLVNHYTSLESNNIRFMGLSLISHQMGGERLLDVHSQSYPNIQTALQTNIYLDVANLKIFYIGQLICNNGTQFYFPTTYSCGLSCPSPNANVSNSCVSCNTVCATCSATDANNCTTCINGTNRTGINCTCNGIFFSNGTNPVCLNCSDYLQYCIYCTNSTICLQCQPGMFLINDTCQCSSTATNTTYLVGGLCLNYPGCIRSVYGLNSNACSQCNSTAYFIDPPTVATNLTCVCISGYSNSKNPLLCQPICGDGIVNMQACDVGNSTNSTNSTGCTNCTIDSGWYCYIAAGTTGPSICLPGSPAYIHYLYSERVPGTNTAKFYFQFYPTGIDIGSNSLQGNVNSSAPFSSMSTTFNASDSKIIIIGQFVQNMQGNNYGFTFNFTNAQNYYTNPITVQAQTNGINQSLTFQNFKTLVKTLMYVFIALAILGLLVGLINAILGYKLIGIQLVLPIQAAFFAAFCMPNSIPYLNLVKYLKLSNGFNQIFPYNYEYYYLSGSKLPRYDYAVEISLNINVMAVLMYLSAFVLLIMQLVYICFYSRAYNDQLSKFVPVLEVKKKGSKKQQMSKFQFKQQGQLGLKVKSVRQNRNIYINNYFFYLVSIFTQQCLFAFIIVNTQIGVSSFIISEDISLIIQYTTVLMVVGNFIFIVSQQNEKKNDKRVISFNQTRVIKYPLALLASYIAMILAMGLFYPYSIAPFVANIFAFIPIIILICLKPYNNSTSKLNFIGAFINLSFPFICTIIYTINSVSTQSEFTCLISAVAILISLTLSQVVAIIRMIIVIPWSQLSIFERCRKDKGNKDGTSLLDKNKEVEMSNMIKNSIKGDGQNLIVDWQQKNKKDYESIKQDEDGSQNSQEIEDELAYLKRRLKKQIKTKRI